MKFHLGSSIGTGTISCTCSFPFDMVPLLQACSCDGVNIMLKTLKHIENLLRTLPTSLPTCTHIFCSSALSSWWFASHQSKRGENGKSLSPILSLKLRFFFCYFFFRISVDFWSNKQNTFVQQIGLSYKKRSHYESHKVFSGKGKYVPFGKKICCALAHYLVKRMLLPAADKTFYWFLSFQRTWDIGFC